MNSKEKTVDVNQNKEFSKEQITNLPYFSPTKFPKNPKFFTKLFSTNKKEKDLSHKR